MEPQRTTIPDSSKSIAETSPERLLDLLCKGMTEIREDERILNAQFPTLIAVGLTLFINGL